MTFLACAATGEGDGDPLDASLLDSAVADASGDVAPPDKVGDVPPESPTTCESDFARAPTCESSAPCITVLDCHQLAAKCDRNFGTYTEDYIADSCVDGHCVYRVVTHSCPDLTPCDVCSRGEWPYEGGADTAVDASVVDGSSGEAPDTAGS